ncbi:hypothetical protein A3780_08150 [Kosakonia radicincitans]|nr:hypothetical protein A3780_08150 [Kosakonia radicincitans]
MNLNYQNLVAVLKKCIFEMMLVAISIRMILAKIVARILMMSKITIMTINYVKRHAEKLDAKNDITHFNSSLWSLEGIAAVSWELPGFSRREYCEQLLKDIFDTITDHTSENIYVMLQLVPEQPDSVMVNYKKTWGLVANSGVNVESIYNKKSFIDKGCKGLVLTGLGSILTTVSNEVQKLINIEEKLFFSNISPNIHIENNSQHDRLTQWIHNILYSNGVVFFPLGQFDEKCAEIVAIGSKSVLGKIW